VRIKTLGDDHKYCSRFVIWSNIACEHYIAPDSEINGEDMFLCVSVACPMHKVEVCSSSKLVQLQADAAISHGEW